MKKELADLINNQVNFEIYSAHIYLNMSCYCAAEGYEGFRNWMEIQYQEEMTHAKKLINYLLDCGYTPKITNWDESPGTEYAGILEVAQISLMHEKVVTERFNYMMAKAYELNDYATINFLNWFINEQVEEEANFEAMIQKIKMVKDAGLYILDQEYAQRVFVDETAE
ncbi:ferritin [Bacilli bacterium PM5-3]|nr:ferritin [Bacilli bacterium PM5-3]MDH6603262.1 ferritin [Bacilli bacterium PM5-9]